MWWLRARRAHLFLTLGMAAFLGLVLLIQDKASALPTFGSSGSVTVRLVVFVPIPLVAALMMSLESRLKAPEISGIRRIALRDTALVVAVVTVAVAASFALGTLIGSQVAQSAGRNVAFLTGLMLLGRALFGQSGALLPTAWLMTVVMVGYRSSNDPYPWTVVPEPVGAPHAAAGAALMLAVGILAQIRTSRTFA
ncbi:hypothetical protein [Streptomyces sp. NBC_01591]|uniref:hypothetical protein n=1 Tax=unclassified Streptomyces TaxID=2593676 RepID=UPI002DD837C4|nr:hypothetical protein [Streptomyces sp. NBC_01591]WSD70569.1 hypothetical protein OG978_26235 [Streptomyces sp. NBC_01591]